MFQLIKVAIAAQTNVITTGDLYLLTLENYDNISILTAII
ncbi:conserved hypothetical protein [Planktothrix serta PCC 8927]|uniref:Uncharacterized protein n=1 Tax=Planktothrix serta PCC 8927 TaxID=671068 RepID=A0A7Z9BPU0_9CYAN|nr:conserved hypothetical protein [Planktothrix serta PCC 8927]